MDLPSPASLANTQAQTAYAGEERRHKPRIFESFRATAHGVNVAGEAFSAEAVLENLSAGGLFLRLPQEVEVGAELLVVSKIANPANGRTSGPLLAMSGTIIRVVGAAGDACGVAVKFTHTSFL